MDFDFTAEQTSFRDLARQFLARECTTAVVRRLMDDPIGYDPTVWRHLGDLGLLGIPIAEAHGGLGLGPIELALVLEEMGRAVYPGPYFSTVLLAARAIAASSDAERAGTLLPRIASGELKMTLALFEDAVSWGPSSVTLQASGVRGYQLRGIKRFVPYAHVADRILIAARTETTDDPTDGITLFILERETPGVEITPIETIDLTTRWSTLNLCDVRLGPDAVLGPVGGGWPILEDVLRYAAVGAAADMLGTARKSMEMAVEYAKVRHQFGQPIGAFQAVKHMCADMLVEIENSHGAVYYAAWALDAGAPDAALAASVAKAYVGEASRKVCGSAIQVHGGIGFTWDYDLHLYFKRAKQLEPLYGDADHHRELILRETLREMAHQAPDPVLTG